MPDAVLHGSARAGGAADSCTACQMSRHTTV